MRNTAETAQCRVLRDGGDGIYIVPLRVTCITTSRRALAGLALRKVATLIPLSPRKD